MIHDVDLWKEMKMSKWEMHYSGMAEIFLAELEKHNETSLKIMQAKGVVLEIESDLISYLMKGGAKTKKSIQQEERIKVLHSVFDYFNQIAMSNHQMQLIMRRNARENYKLKEEIADLKDQVGLLNKNLNGISDI